MTWCDPSLSHLPCGYDKFIESLSAEIGDPAFFAKSEKAFKGSINGNGFKIWQNSILRGFEAITFGKYKQQNNEDFLRIFMRVPLPSVLVTAVSYAYIFFHITASGFNNPLLLSIFLAAPVFLCIFSFFPDAKAIENKLKEIIKELEAP